MSESGSIAFIDQEHDGSYSGARLVPKAPKKNKQRYDIFKSRYTGVHITSYRRNKSHKALVIFKEKKYGPIKGNITHMTGSFLELDGSPNGKVKTIEDVLNTCKGINLPTPTHIIETSSGHFHLVWTYERPLPWTPNYERWWTAQQKRLIDAFQDFGPDVKACLNPVQFLRNPTQLNPYNHKRRCEVEIHTTIHKTSLGTIQHRLDAARIRNHRISAETIIRQDLRQKQFINETQKQWGNRLGLSERTMNREVPKLIRNGDLQIACMHGNNKGTSRVITYESLIYIEPYFEMIGPDVETQNAEFSELPIERSKTNLSANARLMREFSEHGIEIGLRNKAIFAIGLYEKWRNGGEISFEQIYDRLYAGFSKCAISENEYVRTIKNVLKSKYCRPLSTKKLREWGLHESGNNCNSKAKSTNPSDQTMPSEIPTTHFKHDKHEDPLFTIPIADRKFKRPGNVLDDLKNLQIKNVSRSDYEGSRGPPD